jgi:hypothetical protein
MVEFLNTGYEQVVGTRVSGQIDPQDLDDIKEIVSEKMNRFVNLNWYYEIKDFEGWEYSSFWRDVLFSLMNTEHFGKIAFVGKDTPQHIKSEVASVFTPAQVKYFDIKEKNAALNWVII